MTYKCWPCPNIQCSQQWAASRQGRSVPTSGCFARLPRARAVFLAIVDGPNSAAIFARVMGAKFFLNTSKSSNQVSNLTMLSVVTGPADCTQLHCILLVVSLLSLLVQFETFWEQHYVFQILFNKPLWMVVTNWECWTNTYCSGASDEVCFKHIYLTTIG